MWHYYETMYSVPVLSSRQAPTLQLDAVKGVFLISSMNRSSIIGKDASSTRNPQSDTSSLVPIITSISAWPVSQM